MNLLPSRLLAVTDRHQARAPLLEVVAHLLASGLCWVWLRDRDLAASEREALARALREVTRNSGAILTIGADVDLAERVDADGVHLRDPSDVALARRRLGDQTLVGVSAHSLEDCRAALEAGADYATLSPIFTSASKPGYGPALGVSALSSAESIGLPILALGGVDRANSRLCLEAGAAGVAIMGAAMRPETGVFKHLIEITRRS